MFLKYYGLREQPFGVTPDPRYLYLGPGHREAMASLFYGIESNRGFLALIAKPGMGKTTLLFNLLERFRHTARTAFVFQTQCDSREFLRFLLFELGSDSRDTDFVRMHEEFNRMLLQEARAGRRFIVVVDEAQNLDPAVLETVRLLSDFETPRSKLMQIVLAGQPQLADKLASPALAQLRQRISTVSGLNPLNPREVSDLIDHRLRVAGYSGPSLFTPGARELLAELSEGIPRNINNYCFAALSLGCALRQKAIGSDIIREVANDFDWSHLTSQTSNQGRGMARLEAMRTAELAVSDLSPETAREGEMDPVAMLRERHSHAQEPARRVHEAELPGEISATEAQAYVRNIAEQLRTLQSAVNDALASNPTK